MLEPISKRLIDAANKLVAFDAGHDPFYWDDKEVLEYKALEAAFKSLALEVENELIDSKANCTRKKMAIAVLENACEGYEKQIKRHQEREQLWRELDKCYRFIGTVEKAVFEEEVKRLRKQLGLEE